MSCIRDYCPHCKTVRHLCDGFCNACGKSVHDNEEKAREKEVEK